jgi:nucleotide-binding universal stress UspA family protein
MSYQVIVVGTDGSPRAGVAVEEALELARLTGATVHAVHAIHTPAVIDDPQAAQAMMDGMRNHADAIQEELLEHAKRKSVTVEFHSSVGEPANALVELAETVNADLVVVGNRGMSGMKRFVLGSVPNKVSHHCPCSVLIVDTERK